VTETPQQESRDEGTIAWMRALAAISLEDSPLPDTQVLWWKGRALRRLDRERAAMSPLDLGEYVLIGGGSVAALAFFVWLLMIQEVRTLPSFGVAVTISVAFLCVAAAVTFWPTTSTPQE
jgi:hypothetical protein